MAKCDDRLVGRWMYHMEGNFNGAATLAVGIIDFGSGIGGRVPVTDFGARAPSPLKAPPAAADEGSPANFGVGGVLQVIGDCSVLSKDVVRLGFRNGASLDWTFVHDTKATLKGAHASIVGMTGSAVRIP